MNQKEILNHAPALFEDVEKWVAFNEIADARKEIKSHWFKVAAQALRQHFRLNPRDGWKFEPWGSDQDTRWCLDGYHLGLCVGFGWEYQFHLYLFDTIKFDSEKISSLLHEARYAPIFGCFERVDRQFEADCKAMIYGNFYFGSQNDGHIPPDELAWYAGNKTTEFVQQAVQQLTKFLDNAEITTLLRELNQNGQRQP